ncbi:hypothetical protein FKO01_05010 [Mesorhizobium sp. B2-3-3]|nr:hypothetical protein FKO01_05010 [Mesorhizobium sp. B2-3-3]
MLARLKAAAQPDAAYFKAALKLPKPSAEYTAAEQASRDASADLSDLTRRREKLKVESNVQNPTKTILPTATFVDMLDTFNAQIATAQGRDREARAEFELQKTAYHEHVRTSLAGEIASLGDSINRHIDRVMELLDIAVALGAEARQVRVELPGMIGGAPAAKEFLQAAVDSTITRMFQKGSRA